MAFKDEADLELACVHYAYNKGYMHYKMDKAPTWNGWGWPDDAFFGPKGHILIVEFKFGKGKLSPRQRTKIRKLLDRGFIVYVVRTFKGFKSLLQYR